MSKWESWAVIYGAIQSVAAITAAVNDPDTTPELGLNVFHLPQVILQGDSACETKRPLRSEGSILARVLGPLADRVPFLRRQAGAAMKDDVLAVGHLAIGHLLADFL